MGNLQLKSTFFLFIFSVFLVLPVVITVANMQTDLSTYFTMNEEETSNSLQEILSKDKINFKDFCFEDVFIVETTSKLSKIHKTSFFDSEYAETLSPPPELGS